MESKLKKKEEKKLVLELPFVRGVKIETVLYR